MVSNFPAVKINLILVMAKSKSDTEIFKNAQFLWADFFYYSKVETFLLTWQDTKHLVSSYYRRSVTDFILV